VDSGAEIETGRVGRPDRRRFGRLAVAGAAAAALSPALTGCAGWRRTGRAGSPTGPLVYWGGAPSSQVAAHAAELRPLLAAYTATTGQQVRLRVLGWEDLFGALVRSLLHGDGPDVAEIRTPWSVTLQSTGGLAEVDAAVIAELGGRKRFLDAPWHTAGAGGRPPNSVPVRASVRVLLHDTGALEASGLAAPPSTWAELDYVAPLLARGGRHVLSWAGDDFDALTEDLILLTRQAGGELLGGETPMFTTTPVRWALNLRLRLAAAALAATTEVGITDPVAPARAVAHGRAAAALVESTALGALAAEGPPTGRLGVALPPTLGHTPYQPHGLLLRSLTGGTNLVVPVASARSAAAWRLIAHLTDDTRQQAIDPKTGSLPVVSSAWTARTTARDQLLFGILTLGSLPMPATVHQPQLRTAIGTMLHGLLADRPGVVPGPARQLASLRSAQTAFTAQP
jgi:ABC-type glycerol-3-phosphate transport system substrate-binding protein